MNAVEGETKEILIHLSPLWGRWNIKLFFFSFTRYRRSGVGRYDPTRQANIHIKEKCTSVHVHVASEQKQETNRKQEARTPITTAKPEVASRPWRSGAWEMLHNITCLLLNLRRAHKLPLCETINTVMVHPLTQSCCFINNATLQTWAPQLSLTVTTVRWRRQWRKLYGTNVKKVFQVYGRC